MVQKKQPNVYREWIVNATHVVCGVGYAFALAIPLMPRGPVLESPHDLFVTMISLLGGVGVLHGVGAVTIPRMMNFVRVVTDGRTFVFMFNRRVAVMLSGEEVAAGLVSRARGFTVVGAEDSLFISPAHTAHRVLLRLHEQRRADAAGDS